MSRADEIAEGLHAVRQRIGAAATHAGRDADEIALIVVTKFFPATDVVSLMGLGVRDIGENRDQEARTKVAETAALLAGAPPPRVHFIGQAQRNKAGSIALYSDSISMCLRRRPEASPFTHICGGANIICLFPGHQYPSRTTIASNHGRIPQICQSVWDRPCHTDHASVPSSGAAARRLSDYDDHAQPRSKRMKTSSSQGELVNAVSPP